MGMIDHYLEGKNADVRKILPHSVRLSSVSCLHQSVRMNSIIVHPCKRMNTDDFFNDESGFVIFMYFYAS